MGVTSETGITAVICTHNRPELLERALASLVALDPPASEVLIVDNAPSDDRTMDLVASKFPGVRYVREDVAGRDFARNRALAEASQPRVAFMDDDAIADPAWCGALAAVLRANPALGACTGRVEPLEVVTESQRMFEANGGFSQGLAPIRLPEDMSEPLHGHRAPPIAWATRMGCGCNMAVRKDLALAIGGFDTALDMGSVLPGGGDIDMLWRLLDAGHGLEYNPGALVLHEHRRDMPSIERQLVGHQRGLMACLGKSFVNARRGTRASIATYLIWRLAKPLVRVAKRLAGRDPLPVRILLRMGWNCWVGAFYSYRAGQREAARRIEAAAARRIIA